MLSNRKQAQANELAVLTGVGEVGWLSTSQAARWVWPASTLHVGTNKAAAVLARLTEQGHLLCRLNALGVRVFVLTTKGALRANTVYGPAYCAGYKLSQLDSYRQQQIVEFLLSMRAQGHTCTGPAGLRRAIMTGAVLDCDLQGADALIQDCQTGALFPALLVRSLNLNVVAKAIRLKSVNGSLHLFGSDGLVRQFERAMDKMRRERRIAY